jgi:uncharacterized SAM-binding protein YcdF (DUF218 family)
VNIERRQNLWRWEVRAALFSIAALLLFCSRSVWLTWAAQFLNVSNPPAHVDCVMVLGGGSDTRPFVAADWFLRGKSTAVLVPTVHTPPELVDEANVPDHEVIRRVLLAQGLPAEALVFLPGECSSTKDEAAALASYLNAHPGVSVAIVTNTLYTRRTRSIICRQLGDKADRVFYVGAPTERFDATNWWTTEEGFNCYATEFVKLTRHWLSLD